MTEVTIAPITSTIRGLSSEVLVGPGNGLDHDCAVSLDNVLTVPVDALGRTVGYLSSEQEALSVPPSGGRGISDEACIHVWPPQIAQGDPLLTPAFLIRAPPRTTVQLRV